jgi:hypothetical protein
MKIGCKVICVSDCFDPLAYGEVKPVKGRVYTIRDVVPRGKDFPCGLRLQEIDNALYNYNGELTECSFDIRAFRVWDNSYGNLVIERLERELNIENAGQR